jgi:hypothetical protein
MGSRPIDRWPEIRASSQFLTDLSLQGNLFIMSMPPEPEAGFPVAILLKGSERKTAGSKKK